MTDLLGLPSPSGFLRVQLRWTVNTALAAAGAFSGGVVRNPLDFRAAQIFVRKAEELCLLAVNGPVHERYAAQAGAIRFVPRVGCLNTI
ncbi:hypothetical protein ACIHFE_19305 [Streptomyces sp. NPDC052396]|uniref:hypothetical protein n=1 Tax=Streptomyces sp. NPDC052396 TaxID=3365689 RepID=UPI0037D88B8D